MAVYRWMIVKGRVLGRRLGCRGKFRSTWLAGRFCADVESGEFTRTGFVDTHRFVCIVKREVCVCVRVRLCVGFR